MPILIKKRFMIRFKVSIPGRCRNFWGDNLSFLSDDNVFVYLRFAPFVVLSTAKGVLDVFYPGSPQIARGAGAVADPRG